MPGRHSLKQLFGGDVRREKANYVIQSVSHALDVLEQFAGDAEELGVTELSKRLRLHKNNVFRLLATLESRGYIEQHRATENYRRGVRRPQLGQGSVGHMGLRRQALLQQLRTVAANGYAVDLGEHLEDVRAVAAPVRDYARAVVGALAVVAPASRLTPERIEKEVAPLVLKAGRELSSRLGFDVGRREAQA